MRVRVPYWAVHGVTAKLNDRTIENNAEPSSWLSVTRRWQDQDRLEVVLPMSVHVAPLPDDPTTMAFMYGPLVLAGKLGGHGLSDDVTYTDENWFRFPRDKIADAPEFVIDSADASCLIRPVQTQPLTFRTAGQQQDIKLVPYYRLFGERYAVYWRVYRRGSEEHRRAQAAKESQAKRFARRVDHVEIGERVSESDHQLKGEQTQSGSHLGYHWRHATDGAWFSYQLKVQPEEDMVLWCRYWGDEGGQRTFDVLVDGQKIATQTLFKDKPGEFFEVEYPIPPEMISGKQVVTVRFQASRGNFAGGIFGCEMLKRDQM